MTIFSPVPNVLANGTTADGPQVKANFDQIIANGNSLAAHNGANSDITQLSGLTTPLSVAQGGTAAATASAARTALSAAQSGANADITSLSALSGGSLAPPTVALQNASNALSGNVALNNTAAFFDGPSMAQGTSGTWFVSGTVTVQDNASAANILAKLWDGTTVIASTQGFIGGVAGTISLTLSGIIASPAGNIRISVADVTTTSGLIRANSESVGNLSSRIWGVRIG